jgi:16S rRNA (uracil1498-N3)-methyltransferase
MAIHDFRSQRLYVDADLAAGATVTCNKEQANYLLRVMRLGAGDEILVFNGRNGEWLCRIEPRSKRDCDLSVVEQLRVQLAGPDIDYLFAPLKRARLDYMVPKATEMGVASMQPVLTERTVVGRVNTDRMRSNVIEAVEQCGVLRVPEVREPCKLSAALATCAPERSLFFADEAAEVTSPLRVFDGIERGAPVAVIVGPEGGFSASERKLIQAQPQTRVLSLGPRVMRADTAAVALLALVNAVVGDWH